ncbi:MAG TPA: GNAT family protein, partial [Candidatus Limnocylindrales bacterium]
EPWQAEEFLAHVDRLRDYLHEHVPLPGRVTDLAAARAMLQRYADSQAADGNRIYGIWVEGVLSGGVTVKNFDAKGGTCELGVWLAPDAQGRGLMTAAVRHVIDWAIGVRGFGRIEWLAVVGNERSIALAKRVGMSFEGVKRSDFILNGVRRDSEVYAITADDWFPLSDKNAGSRSGTS